MKTSRSYSIGLLLILTAILFSPGCTNTTSPADNEPSAFVYEKANFPGATPWTSEEFRNDPANFQFAIIGDRTGGANAEGTFRLAMDQLNLLQPEFVINVGDLIEGYPEDRADVNSMWDEAASIMSELQMPFFHVMGNHDVSSPMTKEVWMERFGKGYYSFVYQDVLFMVLNSEDDSRPDPPENIMVLLKEYGELKVSDPEAAMEMLKEFMTDEAIIAALGVPVEFPEAQLAWIEERLNAHPDVRWTFFFMHEPCWENPSESFVKIQGILKDRKHTMFAGHLHYYDYDNIDGVEYITMGPAGASFHHEGPGNVDHITWVTMTEKGPQIGNIAMKGIFDRKGLDPELFGAYDRKGYVAD